MTFMLTRQVANHLDLNEGNLGIYCMTIYFYAVSVTYLERVTGVKVIWDCIAN